MIGGRGSVAVNGRFPRAFMVISESSLLLAKASRAAVNLSDDVEYPDLFKEQACQTSLFGSLNRVLSSWER
jgi:hypothetical protein